MATNKYYFYWAISILIFIIFLSFNGFSILYTSDSGAYLLNSRELKVPGDRSIYYSCLIAALNLITNSNLLFQTFIHYLFFICIFNHFFDAFKIDFKVKCFILIIVSILTPCIWLFIQLMPDFSLSIAFLIFTILLNNNLNKIKRILFSLFFVIELILHNSNSIIFLLFSIGLFLFTFLINQFKKYRINLLKLSSLSLLSLFLIIGTNVFVGNGFTLGKSSKIFFMGKLCENGVLETYLNDNCNNFPNKLCAYKNNLPEHGWDFVWEENGAFQNSGGWDHSDTLYHKIINDILFKPKYSYQFIIASFYESFKQLPLNGAGDGMSKMDTNQTTVSELKNYHTYDYYQLIAQSNQQKLGIDFGKINTLYYFFQYILLSIAVLLLIVYKNGFYIKLFMYTLFFHICNASFTGAFVNVINRLNTRSMWILELVCVVIIVNTLICNYNRRINSLHE